MTTTEQWNEQAIRDTVSAISPQIYSTVPSITKAYGLLRTAAGRGGENAAFYDARVKQLADIDKQKETATEVREQLTLLYAIVALDQELWLLLNLYPIDATKPSRKVSQELASIVLDYAYTFQLVNPVK